MKKKLKIFCVILITVITGLVRCNSATETDYTVPTETSGSGDSTVPLPAPPTPITEDTSFSPEVKPEKEVIKKTAKLGYSYYPKMKRGEMKIIRAYVSINHPESKIRDTLRRIEKIQTVEKENADTSTINIINNIPFYKKIKIVIDSTNDFTIKAYRPAQQAIDTLKGNLWLWQITPLTDKTVAVITILVDAESPEGVLENIDIREIKVKIEIDKITFVRAAINYLGDNPKISIPIIVGLVTFIGWLIKYFLERKKAGARP